MAGFIIMIADLPPTLCRGSFLLREKHGKTGLQCDLWADSRRGGWEKFQRRRGRWILEFRQTLLLRLSKLFNNYLTRMRVFFYFNWSRTGLKSIFTIHMKSFKSHNMPLARFKDPFPPSTFGRRFDRFPS